MDGSPDGTLAVLGKRFDGVSTIAVTDIEGHVLREMQLPPIADMIYGDVAVAPDGRYFASVVDIERLDDPERTEAATSIVVLTPSGAVEREIDFQAIFPVDHSIPGHAHALVRGIDVASDGRLFALIAFRGCG